MPQNCSCVYLQGASGSGPGSRIPGTPAGAALAEDRVGLADESVDGPHQTQDVPRPQKKQKLSGHSPLPRQSASEDWNLRFFGLCGVESSAGK